MSLHFSLLLQKIQYILKAFFTITCTKLHTTLNIFFSVTKNTIFIKNMSHVFCCFKSYDILTCFVVWCSAGSAECLLDQPGRRRVRAEKGEAGELYRIDKQCELMFGPDFKICPYMVIIAQVTNRQRLLRPVIYRLIKEFCIISWKKSLRNMYWNIFFLISIARL